MKINVMFEVTKLHVYDFMKKENKLTSPLQFHFTVSNADKDLSTKLKETKGADMHVIVKSVQLDRHEIAKHKARVNIN